MDSADAGATLFTLGHSNRPIEELVRLLRVHGIRRLADVRSLPRSRRHPHFDAAALRVTLAREGLAYEGLPQLGGRRSPRPGSRNRAVPAALRGYADHMETADFARAVDLLLVVARQAPTAVLCAEADWRQCHRSLLADALHVRGVRVLHIVGEGAPEPHELTAWARLVEGRLCYPGGQGSLF